MKARQFDAVIKKFGMETRDTGDRHAWLIHEGKTVVRTKRSHGHKPVLQHHVRQQLKLNDEQIRDAIGCTLGLDGYIKILKDKGVIEDSKPDQS